MDPGDAEKETRRSRAAAATSAARSLLCLLESDAVVAHRAAAAFGETRLFRARGPNRHRAVRRRAPADDRRARRERRAESRRARRARRHLFSRRRAGSASLSRSDEKSARTDPGDAAMGDADDLEMDDLEMDDNGGVQSAADASRAAKDAEAAALEAVNAKANARAAAKVGVTGTAAKVGVTFFAHLIEVLAGLTQLRGPLLRAAADASLALWALAWQPSNRRSMSGEEVIAPLVALYALEGERAAPRAPPPPTTPARCWASWRACASAAEKHRICGPHAREAAGEAPAGRQRSRITGIELGIERGRRRRRARRESFRLFARSVFLRGARGREKDAKRTRGTERPGRASERVDVPKHPADHLGAARRRRHRARVAAQVRPSEATRGPFFYITTHENVQRPIIKMTVLASRVECQVFGAPRHLI